jgi:hypothetical protein
MLRPLMTGSFASPLTLSFFAAGSILYLIHAYLGGTQMTDPVSQLLLKKIRPPGDQLHLIQLLDSAEQLGL